MSKFTQAPIPLSAREQILVEALQTIARECGACDTTALDAMVRADVATPEEIRRLYPLTEADR
jgi:hypothetical protein